MTDINYYSFDNDADRYVWCIVFRMANGVLPKEAELLTKESKLCTKCGLIKKNNLYAKSGKDKYGNIKYRADCKDCTKKGYEEQKDQIALHRKNRRQNNDCVREYHRNYHRNHKEKIHVLQKQYRDDNKDKVRARKKIFYANNPDKKFIKICRNRIAAIFKTGRGSNELLGCTSEFLYEWLMFNTEQEENMTLDNYGSYWHIDHVIPCAKWDMNNEEHKKKCFHWTNLSPLEAEKNTKKGSKIIDEQLKKHKKRIKQFINDYYPELDDIIEIDEIARPTIAGNSLEL